MSSAIPAARTTVGDLGDATMEASDTSRIEEALTLLAESQFTLDQLFYQLAARRIRSGKRL